LWFPPRFHNHVIKLSAIADLSGNLLILNINKIDQKKSSLIIISSFIGDSSIRYSSHVSSMPRLFKATVHVFNHRHVKPFETNTCLVLLNGSATWYSIHVSSTVLTTVLSDPSALL
jgi:hypothetical protein